MREYGIKIVILSRGRSNTITTHKIVPEYIEVVVPDDEVDLYRKTINNPIIPIPKELEGLGKVRNWCLDSFSEEIVVMMDDDIKNVYCLTGSLSRRIDGDELIQVIINTAVMAKDAGVHCFGFSQRDIRSYNGTSPFSFTNWVGCVMGVIGRKYRFRDDKFKVDIDFVLQNLLVDRIIWQDSRY